jgi:hypothetical protein
MSGRAYRRFLAASEAEHRRLPHPRVRLLGLPRTRRQFITSITALAAIAAAGRSQAFLPLGGTPVNTPSGPGNDPFPRTLSAMTGGTFALYYSGNTTAGVPTATVASESNIMLISVYMGVESYGTYASLMSGWKSAASANGINLRTFMYTWGWGFQYKNPAKYPWLTNAFDNSSMWAYTSAAGSGTTDLLPYGGTGNSGNSYLQITPDNKQTLSSSYSFNGKTGVLAGYNVWDLYAQYFYDVFVKGLAVSKYGEKSGLVPNPYVDGIILDNMTPVPGTTPATWLGLGTTPVGRTAQTIALVQQGQAALADAFRALNSNYLLCVNDAFASVYTDPGFAVDPSNEGLWDVLFDEGTIGYSWSIESFENSPPGSWMKGLIAAEATVAPNGTLVLNQTGGPGGVNNLTGNQPSWGAAQWQAVRFGFAAAMQRNWHYALVCGQGTGNPALMDEQVQTVNGKPNYGWLSAGTQRLDPPQSPSSHQPVTLTGTGSVSGVWLRRYPNGWVLWNPRGNGAVTITNIPTTLSRIKSPSFSGRPSYGNTSVNDGQQITGGSVTLQDADGLFLIGSG